MKITKLETLRLGEFPNLVWLRVHTDQGVVGLGETSYAAQSVETYLHEYVAPRVLGRDPLEIEASARSLTGYLGWRGSGVETRAASAFDLALWDLFGKVCNQPLYQVLGGASRGESAPTTLAPATATSAPPAARTPRTGASTASRRDRTRTSKGFSIAPTRSRIRCSSKASPA